MSMLLPPNNYLGYTHYRDRIAFDGGWLNTFRSYRSAILARKTVISMRNRDEVFNHCDYTHTT